MFCFVRALRVVQTSSALADWSRSGYAPGMAQLPSKWLDASIYERVALLFSAAHWKQKPRLDGGRLFPHTGDGCMRNYKDQAKNLRDIGYYRAPRLRYKCVRRIFVLPYYCTRLWKIFKLSVLKQKRLGKAVFDQNHMPKYNFPQFLCTLSTKLHMCCTLYESTTQQSFPEAGRE